MHKLFLKHMRWCSVALCHPSKGRGIIYAATIDIYLRLKFIGSNVWEESQIHEEAEDDINMSGNPNV